MTLLSVIIVNYNSPFLEHTLDSVKTATTGIPTEIFLVDNNSQHFQKETLLQYKLTIIQNDKNLGFAKANNQAIKQATGDYILLVNPDILLEKDTIKKLLNYLIRHQHVKIVAPQLLNNNGSIQESARPFPKLQESILRRLHHTQKTEQPTQPQQVDWVSGACMLLRGKHYFDERYFLYFEDVDLCRTTGDVHYFPEARATHQGSYASRKLGLPLLYHSISTMKYFWKWK